MFFLFSVFGVDLTTLVMVYDSKRPAVVDACIAEVESRGEQISILYVKAQNSVYIASMLSEYEYMSMWHNQRK